IRDFHVTGVQTCALPIFDPASLDDYKAHGGFRGLANALKLQPQEIVATVTQSGLRGRGGAGFPTGIKWDTVLKTNADQKYIVCRSEERRVGKEGRTERET